MEVQSMEKDYFIEKISTKMKLVRTEYDYSQDKMADILGMSKKTLVQIEKGRTHASWTTVVAFCALFNQSEILQQTLGDEPLFLAQLVAQNSKHEPQFKTMGGKIWWKEISTHGDYKLQQNIVSNHYRILDKDNYRCYSSFDKAAVDKRLQELLAQ